MATDIGFDPVAWSIDGGRHPAELGRVLAYAATGGAEGVVSAADCRVRPLGVPGQGFLIDPGDILIRNRSTGGNGQSYVAHGRRVSTIDALGLQSSAARSHLVVVRVEDPQYSGWPKPPAIDAPTYQYTKPFIIQNVPSTTKTAAELNLGYSAYALARIDLPANTSTIQAAHIKDLRKVARPQRQRFVRIWSPPAGTSVDRGPTSSRQRFPSMQQLISVPEWATEVKVNVIVGGLYARGDVTARIRAELGWNGNTSFIPTQDTAVQHTDPQSTNNVDRLTVLIGGELAIPVAYRGKEHYVRLGAEVTAGTSSTFREDEWMTVLVDLEFVEVAD